MMDKQKVFNSIIKLGGNTAWIHMSAVAQDALTLPEPGDPALVRHECEELAAEGLLMINSGQVKILRAFDHRF